MIPSFVIWAMLHQRDVIALPFGLVAKTTYPVLPWIGVIMLGYALGPWFLPGLVLWTRERRFAAVGVAMLVMFALLRLANGYGDKPWYVVDEGVSRTAMSFFALTKYPPSLLFLLLTLGIGALLLDALERMGERPVVAALAVFGGAPLFFYLLHLTALRLLYHVAFAIWGATQGTLFGLSDYAWVLVWYAALIAPSTSRRPGSRASRRHDVTSPGSSTCRVKPISLAMRQSACDPIWPFSARQRDPRGVLRAGIVMGDGAAFHGAKLALLCDGSILTYLRDDKVGIPFPGFWDLPGGGREGTEGPIECVLRELDEEFALRLSPERLKWSRFYPSAIRPKRGHSSLLERSEPMKLLPSALVMRANAGG